MDEKDLYEPIKSKIEESISDDYLEKISKYVDRIVTTYI